MTRRNDWRYRVLPSLQNPRTWHPEAPCASSPPPQDTAWGRIREVSGELGLSCGGAVAQSQLENGRPGPPRPPAPNGHAHRRCQEGADLRVELDGNFVGGLDLGGLFKQTHRSERVPRRCPWGTSRRAGLAVLGAPRPGCTATSAPTTPAPAAIRFLPCVALAGVPRQQLGPPPSVRRRSAGS